MDKPRSKLHRKLLNICFTCKRLQLRSYSYPEKSNLPGYRVKRTVPFQVCGVDYLGPVFVKDIYHSSIDEMHKAYIVLFTCSTSRAVILDLVEYSTSKNFIDSIKKILQEEVVQRILCLITGKCLRHRKTSLFVQNRE